MERGMCVCGGGSSLSVRIESRTATIIRVKAKRKVGRCRRGHDTVLNLIYIDFGNLSTRLADYNRIRNFNPWFYATHEQVLQWRSAH